MSFVPPSPSQEFGVIEEGRGNAVSKVPPNNNQSRHDSSEGDVPLMTRRQTRSSAKEQDGSTTPREGRVLRDTARNKGRDAGGHARDHSMLRQPTKTSPKAATKHKKPGPKAWAPKPIMKNDRKAKKMLIREIEGYWGRGFIKAYVPKCHRPLVKRGSGGKRSAYREHETNPMEWLPSVLKAILMIAKLTDDREWLEQAMNEVVRYRIKNTGNRKPQLVTTDFDVIEDMLVKDWEVGYSFGIRYKHLMVNPKDGEEDDENIDHILEAGTDSDDSHANDSMSEDEETGEDDDDDEDENQDRSGISNKYQQSSGYTKAPQRLPPAPPRLQPKQPKKNKKTPIKQEEQEDIYGGSAQMPGYGPPIDPWGRPMPGYGGRDTYNNGYGGYGGGYGPGFGGYGGYGFPPPGLAPPYGENARRGSQQPHARGMPPYPSPHHGMTPAPSIPGSEYSAYSNNPEQRGHKRGRASPVGQNKRARDGYGQLPGYGMHGLPNPYHGAHTKIKLESPFDEHHSLDDDFDGPSNDIGAQDGDLDDNDAADAEVEAMEIELKLAKLKSARLREKQRMKK
jgi:hypothetical protein